MSQLKFLKEQYVILTVTGHLSEVLKDVIGPSLKTTTHYKKIFSSMTCMKIRSSGLVVDLTKDCL